MVGAGASRFMSTEFSPKAKGDEYLYKTGWVWNPGGKCRLEALVYPAFSDRIFRSLPENPEKNQWFYR